jgi:hypothetical protein
VRLRADFSNNEGREFTNLLYRISAGENEPTLLYWKFSGSYITQVPVHTSAQEAAYVELVLPELIPFILHHIGENMTEPC